MITILYRPKSEHSTAVEEFLKELDRETISYNKLDVDSKEGIAFAGLQDIMQFPAVVATRDDGTPTQTWVGSLPLIKEVGYFAHQ